MVDVETFGRRRQALRLELKQARTPARQASAAAALHVAALDVEEQVGRVGGGAAAAPDRAAAGGALHASARAYMRLANAARSGDRHAYDLASSQVIRAESRVSIGLQALDGRLAKGVGRP